MSKKFVVGLIAMIVIIIGFLYVETYQDTDTVPTTENMNTQITLSEEDVITTVTQLSDVQTWLTELENSNTAGAPVITVEHINGNVYTVHVYENLPDHTATFGWYDVDITTGVVTDELGQIVQ